MVKDVKKAPKKEVKKDSKLVKMERDGLKADVHPDMVEDYKKAGFK